MGWAVNARDEILEKHLFVNEGEMSSKNSFEFSDPHVLKCESCCLQNHSCCWPVGKPAVLGVQFLLDERNGLVAPRYHRCCTTGDQHCFRRAGVPKQDYFLIFFDSFTWCPLGGTSHSYRSFLITMPNPKPKRENEPLGWLRCCNMVRACLSHVGVCTIVFHCGVF